MDVPVSPTAEWSDMILVLWGMSINTDPFSSTVFLICSELEIHTPLFLQLQIPQVVMEHRTRDLLFLLSDLLWKQKVPARDRDVSQAVDSLSPKPTSRRTLVLLSSSGTCCEQAAAKGNAIGLLLPCHSGEGIKENKFIAPILQIPKLNEKAQMS